MTQQRPTRILRIINKLQINGPARQAVLLTARLNAIGYEGVLLSGGAHSETDSMVSVAEEYGVEIRVMPNIRRSFNPFSILKLLWDMVQFIREYQPDIVHTHQTTAGFFGRLAARLAGVPVVVHTLHEHPFRGYYTRIRTIVFITLERIGALLSDSIITLTEGLRRELTETYHITERQRMTVLPLGFDLDGFSTSKRHSGVFRKAWGIAPDAPLVGIVGRLLPVKNHALFLESAVKVHQAKPNARFVIVGDGEERANLDAQVANSGLQNAVIFTGWQQHVAEIYSDLDVLVCSSWNEGTPVPIIEALSAGCPVVATRVGGVPDLLDGGRLGALVESDDADALADAILATIAIPPQAEIAQQTMLNRYGIERLVQDMDSLYRGLLAKKQHQRNQKS